MSNWKFSLNFKPFWNTDISIEEKGRMVSACVKQEVPSIWMDWNSQDYDEDLANVVEAFENITGYDDVSAVEEFDNWMDGLYNWGDQKVSLLNVFPPNKMCWIETGA